MTKDIATVKAALECTVEHLEGEHDGKVVVNADVFNALYDFAETALSSPPAIDLEGLKREAIEWSDTKYPNREASARCAVYTTLAHFIDHLAATGKLGGDDLGELLKRVPDKCGCELRKAGTSGQWAFKIFSMTADTIYGEGTTPAEAVRKALDTMKDHPNGQ